MTETRDPETICAIVWRHSELRQMNHAVALRRGELGQHEHERYRLTTLCGLPSSDFRYTGFVGDEIPDCAECQQIHDEGDPFERNLCLSFDRSDPRARTQCACLGVVTDGPCRGRELHRITERDDGPDLHDLVRLIEYLREHRVPSRVDSAMLVDQIAVSWSPANWQVVEGHRNGIAFVGPDGTVYDENREAL